MMKLQNDHLSKHDEIFNTQMCVDQMDMPLRVVESAQLANTKATYSSQ
jgi:hypothetical protein